MTTAHTPARQAFHDMIDQYDREHPDHCQTCHGYGMFVTPATSWEPGGCEPCEDCVLEGACPRCGHQHDETRNQDDWDPCESCGFAFDGTGRPEAGCLCDQAEN